MRKHILLLFLWSFGISLYAQEKLGIGQWDDYLPYKRGKWVTQSKDQIYYATNEAVIGISIAEATPTYIGKLQGLNDVGVDLVEYDTLTNQLIVVYNNSNIDLYHPLETYNLPDIKETNNIVGSKKINDVHIYNKKSTFLSTGFGIVELNLDQKDFGSTIITEAVVNDMTSMDSTIYAATDKGLFSIVAAKGVNIADFSQWQRYGASDGLPEDYQADHVEVVGRNIYLVINDELLIKKPDAPFTYVDSDLLTQDVLYINKGNKKLIIGTGSSDPTGKILTMDLNDNIQVVVDECTNYPLYTIEQGEGRYWVADLWDGYRLSVNNNCFQLAYDTPKNANISDVAIRDQNLYIATGGVDVENGYRLLVNNSGMYRYDGKNWKIYDANTLPLMREEEFINVFQVELHPTKDLLYMGSYYEGIIELNLETEETRYFDDSNSALGGIIGDLQRQRVSGMVFDKDKNLWINNFGAAKPLVAMDEEGNWFSFSTRNNTFLADCIVDKNGYIWSVITSGSGGALVYNANGTLSDPTDDQQYVLRPSNTEMTGQVNCITSDLDGKVWVGTTKGPVIFNSSSEIFEGKEKGSVKVVTQDGIRGRLLINEDIRSIAIDGGNRIWFGTRNGIFVQSPTGQDQIAHFTSENSPLFSNVVKELKFDAKSGKMYIGTDFGLQVYRTETEGARKVHGPLVYAFPNPVRDTYFGDIYIKGLARDANVKITDLSGTLVSETTANGGLAKWDGKDLKGRDVVSGVYLVFSTSNVFNEDPDTYVTKILVVR